MSYRANIRGGSSQCKYGKSRRKGQRNCKDCQTAWSALADLLGSHTSEEHLKFMKFAVAHMRTAAVDIVSETNVNKFWTLLVTAFEEGTVPVEYFRVEGSKGECPPGTAWTSYKLFIQIEAVISALHAYLVKRHETLPLRRRDLVHQSSRNEWWLPTSVKRFGKKGSMHCSVAWVIEVDKHPLGRQSISEQLLHAALLRPEERSLADVGMIFRDGDPRKGPLFSIIEGIEEQDSGLRS